MERKDQALLREKRKKSREYILRTTGGLGLQGGADEKFRSGDKEAGPVFTLCGCQPLLAHRIFPVPGLGCQAPGTGHSMAL